MALQVGIIKVTGKVGDLVGYRLEGKHRARKKAENVRRSEPTKLAAIDFGAASSAGKLVRHGVRQGLNIRTDHKLTNRLNAALLKILYASSEQRGSRSFKREKMAALTGFSFNKATDLSRLLTFRPKVVQQKDALRIALPALTAEDVLHAKNTTHIEIKAIAVGVNFQEGKYLDAVTDTVLIDLRKEPAAKELVLPFKAGDEETIVVLQVSAYDEHQGTLCRLGNRKYFAADIIDVIPSLPEEEAANIIHHSRPSKQPLFQLHGDHTFTVPQRE